MYSIFKPSIMGGLFKEQRTSRKLKIADVAKMTHYSSSTISNFENSTTIQEPEKIKFMMNVFEIPEDYFNIFETKYIDVLNRFIKDIVYINKNDLEKTYAQLVEMTTPYNNTLLELPLILCKVMYTLFKDENPEKKDIDYLRENKVYLADSFECITNIYIGQYYTRVNQLDEAKKYFDAASHYPDKTDLYYQMFNLCNAFYYLQINEIFTSLNYSHLANRDFTTSQNYKRLIDLNILRALQYMNVKDYSKALKINISNLEIINEEELSAEKRIVLYNITYIYVLQQKFEEALHYISQIPNDLLTKKHYATYLYILCELSKYKEIKELATSVKFDTPTPFYDELINLFYYYIGCPDVRNFSNELILLYTNHEDRMDLDTKEYFLNMLIYYLEISKQPKKANKYLNDLYILRTNPY